MKHSLILLITGLFFALRVSAEEPSDANLYDSSLEDLMDVRVSTASKEAESLEMTPGVVSVVTEKEIDSYGALTLRDVLERVTSAYFVGTLPEQDGMLSIRGDVTAEYNNHVLILINGRPVRDSVYSGLNQDLYASFPVISIKQIEVVRGPGSVLYGTNAFVGVINILTKDALKDGGDMRVRYGSFDTKQVSAFGAQKFGRFEVSGGLNYLSSTGWNYTAADWNGSTDAPSKTETTRFYNHSIGANLLAKYRKLTLNFYGDKSQNPFMSFESNRPEWSLAGSDDTTRLMADLGYEDKISDFWKTSANLTYNHLANNKAITGFDNDARSNDLLCEWTNFFTILHQIGALAGATYGKQMGGATELTTGSTTIPNYNEDVYSVYAQVHYTPISSLKFLVGGQGVKVPHAAFEAVPRAAILYVLNPQISFKALYSQAFRSPSAAETTLTTRDPFGTSNFGNPNLLPETIGTFDLQALYHQKDFQFSATYFRSRQINLIFPVTQVGTPQYHNAGAQNGTGVELEGKYIVAGSFSLIANTTYQTTATDSGVSDIGHIPNFMLKTGATYNFDFGLQLGVFNSFFEASASVSNPDGTTHQVNPQPDYYNFLTLNANFHLNRIFGLQNFPESYFDIYGMNLLNAQVYYPEYVFGIINSFPGRPGRAFYGSLRVEL